MAESRSFEGYPRARRCSQHRTKGRGQEGGSSTHTSSAWKCRGKIDCFAPEGPRCYYRCWKGGSSLFRASRRWCCGYPSGWYSEKASGKVLCSSIEASSSGCEARSSGPTFRRREAKHTRSHSKPQDDRRFAGESSKQSPCESIEETSGSSVIPEIEIERTIQEAAEKAFTQLQVRLTGKCQQKWVEQQQQSTTSLEEKVYERTRFSDEDARATGVRLPHPDGRSGDRGKRETERRIRNFSHITSWL